MGQEIVYCATCAIRLLWSEFEKGKAFKVGDKSFCAACAKNVLAALPESERKAVLAGLPKDPRRASSPNLPALRPPPSETPKSGSRYPAILPSETPRGGSRALTESSTKIKTTVRRVAPKSHAGAVIAVVAGTAVVLVGLIVALGGRTPKPANPEPPVVIPPATGTTPAPAIPEPPRPPASRPVPPAEREAAAKKSLQEAKGFAREKPGDLAGQYERFKKARWEADDTPLRDEAQKELEGVQKRIVEGLPAEAAPLEEQARAACGREEFKGAIDALEQARPRFAVPEWSALLDAKIQQVRADAQKAYAPLREEALAARRSGAEDKVRAISERIAKWGLPVYVEDLARVLSERTPASAVPAALAAYRKRWEEALARPLAVRDYGEAIRELRRVELPADETVRAEHARDIEDLGLAAALLGDALGVLSKWPKGKPIKLSYAGDRGVRMEVEGPVANVDAHQLEVVADKESFAVPLPEIAAASLAEVFKGRPEAKPEADARAAAVFLALEGEAEEARKAGGGAVLGEKYWTRAQRISFEALTKDSAARELFWKAEDEFHSVSTRAAAIEKYLALLGEHAETAFARRNRALIASRAGDAREYFFYPHDLAAAGTFLLAPGAKVPSCQTSASDSPPEKGKDNYVEIAFYATPEAAPKAWIYAGACCAETFTFYAQVTDLSVSNPASPKTMLPAGPGDNASLLVRNPLLYLKKSHAQHAGPKTPERWAWFEVALPKFPSPGVKKARILTDQQGFSVAYALVSAARKTPPGDAEMKEILKAHAALVPAQPAGAATGTILREYWSDIQGHILSELTKNLSNSPTGTSQLTSLEGPSDFGDNYGTRIRGYVHPPQTGFYTFWIASDDNGELWLSTDDNPANKKKIAWLEGSGYREWEKNSSQKSTPIPLAAGRRYYVEVLHKEGNGGDHVSVGWKLPDGVEERPIPGNRLSPWGAAPAAVAAPPPKRGKPGFYRAINFGGPPLVIDGQAWEGKDAPNYSFKGKAEEHQDVPLNPPTDDNRAKMIRSFIWTRDGSNATLNTVPKGIYQVFIYVWEDSENGSQTFDVMVEGKVVQPRHRSGARGRWDRLGPWLVEVADGTLEVRMTPADANLSGIEVWRVR